MSMLYVPNYTTSQRAAEEVRRRVREGTRHALDLVQDDDSAEVFGPVVVPYRPQTLTIHEIVRVTAEFYGVRRASILKRRRTPGLVRPRHVAIWLARMLTERSLPQIGLHVGGRDHTTVLSAIRSISRKRETDDELEQELQHITTKLGRTLPPRRAS